jgi:pimeloyl-ACP methyl ester carboxylesterase
MENFQLKYKSSLINYYRFGSGKRTAICLHGYGETGMSFQFLEKHLSDQYTFYAVDLPFHGNTKWNEGLNFTTEDLKNIIIELTDSHSLEVVGFSLGGRIALSLYETIPERVKNLLLLAPDGLKINFWYWLSTQTWLGNKIFLLTMKSPGWFFGFIKLLNTLRLVNSSIYKFVHYYINNPAVRKSLYERWTGLRGIKPHTERIKSLIKKNKTPVSLIYGRHDRIILPLRGETFKKGIEAFCTVTIINSGHQVLHEKHINEIAEALLL